MLGNSRAETGAARPSGRRIAAWVRSCAATARGFYRAGVLRAGSGCPTCSPRTAWASWTSRSRDPRGHAARRHLARRLPRAAGAAFVVTALSEGRPGLRRWGGRLFRWGVNWRWYALALLGVPALLGPAPWWCRPGRPPACVSPACACSPTCHSSCCRCSPPLWRRSPAA